MAAVEEERFTQILASDGHATSSDVFVRVSSGPGRGLEAPLFEGQPLVVGTSLEVGLRIDDRSVSRRPLELSWNGTTVKATDLGSTNGSFFEGSRFTSLDLQPGAVVRVGSTELQIVAPEVADPLPPSEAQSFGGLVGKSRKIREVFALLERAARADVTVLIEGETGTGKEVVAHAIHAESRRRDRPFVVVDCAAIAPSLVESELFGHKKGAFTTALVDRQGAFEAAAGGTVFLDEIGELPLDVQPRLLRVLETHTIKPVGANDFRPVDVRVIAATNRDLEAEVEERRFRSDLFFRLAVLRISIPPLRERRDDIPVLARHFLDAIPRLDESFDITPEVSMALCSHDWPGNVRELRNVIQQAATVSKTSLSLLLTLKGAPRSAAKGFDAYFTMPYKDARKQLLEDFEIAYAEQAVAAAGGNVAKAAERAGVHRNALYRILAKTRSD